MLSNYFKTAIRNLLRYKGFTFINILGLTIGIAGCLVIGLFVWDELQYDKFGKDYETVYRIYDERTINENTTHAAVVPPAFATFMKKTYPEVDNTLRIMMTDGRRLMEQGDKQGYEEKGLLTEQSFFSFFPIKLIHGDAATALADPNSVVISGDIAKKFFGKENPVGKTLLINKAPFIVKGVMAALPAHFHLEANYLMPVAAAQLPKERMESWNWQQFYTYIKLKAGTDAGALEAKFQAHVKKEIHPKTGANGVFYLPFLQKLENIHLQSANFEYDNAVRGNETYVKGLSIIALFVLVIACFNFINLATARSLRRAKEIGVRKVVGAERKQLIIQFTGETILLAVIAVILATIATLLIIPVLNNFTGKNISFNPITSPLIGLSILAGGIIVGILAGIYPALVLSGFQPVKVLKGIKIQGQSRGTAWLRQGLVVVQFALSALLIVCTIVVYRQMNYLHNKNLGFNNDQVIYFRIQGGVEDNLETFKQELKKHSGIVSVTSGYGLPGDQFAGDGVIIPGKNGDKRMASNVFIGDHDYIKTLGMELIAGRDFSKEISSDVEEAFVINEMAVKEFGFGTPGQALGQRVNWEKWIPDSANPVKKGRVIGVIKDFHYKSLHEKVTASVIQIYPPVAFKVAAKLQAANMRETISYIDNTWKKFTPEFPLDYKFMDATYGAMYEAEDKLSRLLTIFTIMAIFVGCMGLFGLAAFNAEQRTKEISIRKILGATSFSIVQLLSKTFLKPVLIASLIAFPIAWYAMNKWLEEFPYRAEITWWIFGMAAIIAVVIAVLTVSFQSLKAAFSNPVKNLRTE